LPLQPRLFDHCRHLALLTPPWRPSGSRTSQQHIRSSVFWTCREVRVCHCARHRHLANVAVEIRHYIYGYAFDDEDFIGSKNLTLLLTCRQIYLEAKTVAFEKTLFYLRANRCNIRRVLGRTRHSPASDDTLELIRRIKLPKSGNTRFTQSLRDYRVNIPLTHIELELDIIPWITRPLHTDLWHDIANIWDIGGLVSALPSLSLISYSQSDRVPPAFRIDIQFFELRRDLQVVRDGLRWSTMSVHKVGNVEIEAKPTVILWFPLTFTAYGKTQPRNLTIKWETSLPPDLTIGELQERRTLQC
jgi:hypothetical protein